MPPCLPKPCTQRKQAKVLCRLRALASGSRCLEAVLVAQPLLPCSLASIGCRCRGGAQRTQQVGLASATLSAETLHAT